MRERERVDQINSVSSRLSSCTFRRRLTRHTHTSPCLRETRQFKRLSLSLSTTACDLRRRHRHREWRAKSAGASHAPDGSLSHASLSLSRCSRGACITSAGHKDNLKQFLIIIIIAIFSLSFFLFFCLSRDSRAASLHRLDAASLLARRRPQL